MTRAATATVQMDRAAPESETGTLTEVDTEAETVEADDWQAGVGGVGGNTADGTSIPESGLT